MPEIENLPITEALAFWGEKIPLEPEAFYALGAEYRARAFTVSGLHKMDQIMAVQESFGKALAEGLDFRAWRSNTQGIFDAAGLGTNFNRLDTIYRANIMQAYNAGRWTQAQEAQQFQPFGMYQAIDDDRVRHSHLMQDGKVYPLNHPYWNTWWPPNGYKCRCRVVTLSAQDVKDMGLKIESNATPLWQPDKGFEINPGREPHKLSLDKYPDALKNKFFDNLRVEAQRNKWPTSIIEQMLDPKDVQKFRALFN